MITLLLTTDAKGGMGLRNTIPWIGHVPLEVTRPEQEQFHINTSGKACIMGRNNYQRLRAGRIDNNPLLGNARATWVLSSSLFPKSDSDVQFKSMNVLNLTLDKLPKEQEVMVVGGLITLESFLPRADKIIWNVFSFAGPADTRWTLTREDLEKKGFVLTGRQLIHPLLGTAIFYHKDAKVPW